MISPRYGSAMPNPSTPNPSRLNPQGQREPRLLFRGYGSVATTVATTSAALILSLMGVVVVAVPATAAPRFPTAANPMQPPLRLFTLGPAAETASISDLAKRILALSSGAARAARSSSVTAASTSTSTATSPGNAPATTSTILQTTVPSAGASSNANSGSSSGGWSATVVDTSSLVAKFASQGLAPSATTPTTLTQQGATAVVAVPAVPGSDDDVAVDDRAALVHLLAGVVADRTQVDATALEAVWLRTDDRRMRVILTAMAQVGTPYRYSGNQPGGFDCSGLTSYSWSQVGVKIPRSSSDQINAMAPRTLQQMLPGDIIWRPGHVGMYLGFGDAMVHSPQTGKSVEVRKIGSASRYGSPLVNG